MIVATIPGSRANKQRERKQLTAWKQTGKSDVPAQKTNPTAELGQGRARLILQFQIPENQNLYNEPKISTSEWVSVRHVFLTMQSLLDTETYKALCVLDHAEAAMCLAMTETQGLGSVGNFGQNPPRLTCKISMNASRIYKTQTDKTPEHIGKVRPLPYVCIVWDLIWFCTLVRRLPASHWWPTEVA